MTNQPPKNVVIIGGGHAAAQLVTSLRMQKAFAAGLTLILASDEDNIPYQRPPLSKAYLKGELDMERLPINRASAYEQAGISLKLGSAAQSIDRDNKTVQFVDGSSLAYDKLILATGGRARTLTCPGGDDPRVHVIRTLGDVDALRPQFEAARRVAIIGGGYIGLEAASVAADAGKKVTVLEAEDRILARVVAPEVSAFYSRIHRDHGVTIVTNAKVTALQPTDGALAVTCEDGQTLDADLVLVGIGLIANSELAQDAGLEVDRLGIRVGADLLTSDPDIYAMGDVASFHHPRYGRQMRLESVQNAVDQAKVVANGLMGETTSYDVLPWFWSDQYGIKLQIAGLSNGADTLITRGDTSTNSAAFFYLKEGVMIAADCAGRVSEFMNAKKLITAGVIVDSEKLADESRPFKEIAAEIIASSS